MKLPPAFIDNAGARERRFDGLPIASLRLRLFALGLRSSTQTRISTSSLGIPG